MNLKGCYRKGISRTRLQSTPRSPQEEQKKISIDPSDRKKQEMLERQFAENLSILEPLKARIKATDELTDEIVYKWEIRGHFPYFLLDLVDKYGKCPYIYPEVIIQLGRPPVRIDILTYITGVRWNEVWKNRIKGTFGKSRIPTYFIGKKQLIENKTATGQDQDLLDAKKLKKLKE